MTIELIRVFPLMAKGDLGSKNKPHKEKVVMARKKGVHESGQAQRQD